MSFSPSSLLANFSAESRIIDYRQKDAARRTQPSLLDLFRRESEHGQQFDNNFDHRFNHSGCGLDLRINLEPIGEIFDTFEDIEKGIVAFPHIFGRLADACIIIG